MPQIDLHVHSTASDGTVSPAGIARMAQEIGLAAVALTDHDTVDGLPEFLDEGRALGIECIPGCELAALSPHGSMDILGYYVPLEAPSLTSALYEIIAKRNGRNAEIMDRLRETGLDVSLAEVEEISGGGTVGRPHIAQLLMAKGYVSSLQEAFDRYIGGRGKAYVPKASLTIAEAITLLKEIGCTVVLAHPYLYRLSYDGLGDYLVELRGLGLDGIEALYPEHTSYATEAYIRLADRMGMIVTGGSDFHGSVKPGLRLGAGKGNLNVSSRILDLLKERRAAQGLPV